MSRSPSLSTYSNNSGLANHGPSSPTNVHPPPAYVAAFGASQVVSDAKRHFSDDEDDEAPVSSSKAGFGEMDFSPAALVLLNAFLDQLLYSILSVAKSTTLVALRPAVVEVLKARLASEAIASAEEELQELLAGGEDEEEEMNDRQTKSERQRRWDTELVWKRTRLRVMVYIRLGEMEDDDEERFVREDELFAGNDRRFSQSTGLVSWAAAIFLTSVVEFVAEQVLKVSSQAAASRVRRRSRVLRVSLADAPGAVSLTDGATAVEERDMEKVALNSSLGRLWRTWRKSIRDNANAAHSSPSANTSHLHQRDLDHVDSPVPSQSRTRDVLASAGMVGARRSSSGTAPDSVSAMEDPRAMSAMSTMDGATTENDDRTDVDDELPEAEYPEYILAANIPIVFADEQRDIDEIEIPGLARDPDAERQPPAPMQPQRRHSFSGIVTVIQIHGPAIDNDLSTSNAPGHESGELVAPVLAIVSRQRSHSVPTAKSPAFQPQHSAEPVVKDGAGEDVIDDKPEQKANAAEMAGLKRKVSTERSGAVKASKDDTPEAGLAKEEDETTSVSSGNSANEDPKPTGDSAATASTEHKGLVGGAVAVASAAAAAAVSLVSGSKENETKKDSLGDAGGDAVQNRAPSANTTKRDAVSPLAERLSSASLRDEPQIMESKQVSLSPPPTPQRLVRTHTPLGSKDSFSLDDSSGHEMPQRPLARPRQISIESGQVEPVEEEDADIGVARTSDTAVSKPPGEQPPEIQSRDSATNSASRRPGRLVIGASSPEAPSPVRRESPSIERQTSELTPEDFLHRRALSVTTQQSEKNKVQALSPNQQTRASKRASLPSALVINQGEKAQPDKTPSPWRQSFSAAVEKNTGWASPKKKASTATLNEPDVPVQEHPVVQKIATMKRNETKYQEDENGTPLTSANIKGPADFEMFVQGGDTVKYTLTPENVRDDPTFSRPPRTVERSVSPAVQESLPQTDARVGRSQAAKQTTSSRIIIEPDADVDDHMTSRSSRDTKHRSISRPVARNTSVHRRSGLMAREPQVVTESTRDFADFIRSTGPAKDPEVLPIMTNRSSASIHSLRSGSRPPSAGGASVRSMNRSSKRSESAPPVPPVPSGNPRSNMQARSASSAADTSTELIDFIRSGPTFSDPSEHRISRSVAPFRTTMDSDQLIDWGERLANQPEFKSSSDVEPSVRSASRSSFKSSFRTSANSKSALLSGASNEANSNRTQSFAPTLPRSVLPGANGPVRKRVRSKDPYAIDIFDDDDDDLLNDMPNNRPQVESLIDFLRTSAPSTPNETPGQANGDLSGSRGNAPSFPPRRSSNQGLKTFGADAVSMGRRGSGPTKDSAQQRVQTTPRNGTTSIAVGPITKPRSQLQARGESNGLNGGTMDLSDFLQSSGPEANATAARQTSRFRSANPEKKKSSRFSFFAFFSKGGRNERQGTKQYLDM